MLTIISQNDKVMVCIHVKDADAAQRIKKTLANEPTYKGAGFEEADIVTDTVTVPMEIAMAGLKDIQV